jgi:hypothetical protein
MRKGDLIAGLSVAGLMLPEAVAYAGIAGLPPQRAIFAAIAGCLVYAWVGRSRFAIVSPTSSSAAILAAALAVLPGDATQKALLATLAVGLVGLCFLVAALARLGGLTGFVSRPVLRGFAFGLAVTIILRAVADGGGRRGAGTGPGSAQLGAGQQPAALAREQCHHRHRGAAGIAVAAPGAGAAGCLHRSGRGHRGLGAAGARAAWRRGWSEPST